MVLDPLGKAHVARRFSEPSEEDPAVSRVLHFLAMDIHYCPDRLRAVGFRLLTRINSLVDHLEVDLNHRFWMMASERGSAAKIIISADG
ncbi:type II toxin-antitoxin system PrlF family antitoxin [Pseudomonas fluorescens]|uniref:Uncharacterized protein n=1 Tax=Pseudomonas fluorescens TaxID=294 RepID=A0A5E7APT0_PSEFL|nr:type II toxin-antitoxin system PrlF family antitoxin [Pseudomonas fluorescens]VVN78597.1 hypothetical protein PS704_00911 [Pseudomonas fluorescens]